MLESVKISRRQSEIRGALAALVGKDKPSDDEVRSMTDLDKEYQTNEARFRAALVVEDEERQKAKGELETRSAKEWGELIGRFEMRQVVLALDEGASLSGPTAEIVAEMRSRGGFRGIPIPWLSLERRVGETTAAGVFDPKDTKPLIDRLFPASVAGRMGAQMVNIDSGLVEWPVTSSSVSAGWAATETGAVAGPTQFTTVDKPMAPNNTLGVQMKITRRSLKQSGPALEDAIRRDMSGAIESALDRAVFLGAGSGGEPAGVLVGSYSITSTAVSAMVSWAAFRGAVVRFMAANAASAPGDVRLLVRPEVYDAMDNELIMGTDVSEWDRLRRNITDPVMSSNALDNDGKALLTTSAGGVSPVFVGLWGGVDLIRDPFSDAASGGLRLTGLITADLTVARGSQLQILTGLELSEGT